MTPSIDVRYRNLVKAIEQVILPSIAPENALAREQAALAIAQLRMMELQAPYHELYEEQCMQDMEKLANALCNCAAGGAHTQAALANLRDTAGASADKSRKLGQSRDRRNALAKAIDALVISSHKDGSDSFKSASQSLILKHGKRQSWRDRSWFAAAGFDPDPAQLLPIEQLVLEYADDQTE